MNSKKINEKDSFRKFLMGYYTLKDIETVLNYIEQNPTQAKEDFDVLSEEVWNKCATINIPNTNCIDKYRNEANQLLIRKKFKQRTVYRLLRYASVAAVLLVLIVTSFNYLFLSDRSRNLSMSELASKMSGNVAKTGDVLLVLEGDSSITVQGKQSLVHYDDSGTVAINQKIVTTKNQTSSKEVSLNQLLVPQGKRSILELPDGSKLWVNSGSQVLFPSTFQDNKREIFVNGEIYIDVMPDNKRPFIVSTRQMDIRVLGTSFNVTAYESDAETSVVLVKGLVNIKANQVKEIQLNPNTRFSFTEGKATLQKVDVFDYITWKEGFYQYKSERISVITRRLSRYYGINIDCDPSVSELTCSGKLDLQEKVEDVIDNLCKTASINYYFANNQYKIMKK